MSIRRIMLFTLGGFFKSIISLFKTRVLSDGGNFEAENNLENQLNTLGSTLFDSASLIITPNGVKTSKLYSIKPNDGTGDLSVIRATTATRVNENGVIVDVPANVARIDYSNGSPAILVEPQRTNLRVQSGNFISTSWIKSNVSITPNTTVSPDGGNNGATLSVGVDASSTRHRLAQQNTYTNGTTYNGCFFLKRATHDWVQICGVNGFDTNVWANFNIKDGTVGNFGTNTVASIENYGNGWFRCSIRGITNSTGTFTGIELVATNNLNSNRYPSYQSDSIEDVCYVWGAQLEQGSNATSYIPTTTSSVTRNADVISKSEISSLIGQTEGTMYWEGFLTRNSSTSRLIAISNSAISNRAVLNINNNRIELINRSNNTNANGSISASSLSEIKNGLNKIAARYQSGNTALYVNGVLVNLNIQTFNYTSTIDRLFLVSSEIDSSNINNASIKFAILSSTILNNQQLQQLTTL